MNKKAKRAGRGLSAIDDLIDELADRGLAQYADILKDAANKIEGVIDTFEDL